LAVFSNKAQIYSGLQSLQNLFINRIADGHALVAAATSLLCEMKVCRLPKLRSRMMA
jgi:hypothetical protein